MVLFRVYSNSTRSTAASGARIIGQQVKKAIDRVGKRCCYSTL